MAIFDARARRVEKLVAKKDVEGLIKALGHEDKDVRIDAVMALDRISYEIGDKRAVDPLIAVLKKDEDCDVRASAAIALGPTADWLGRARDERIVESLIATLGDEHWGVQRNAASTLVLLTKMNLGTDQRRWQQWWKKQK